MTLTELLIYNRTLIASITDERNTVNIQGLLEYVLPLLNASRLTDSEIYTPSHFSIKSENIEVDGYLINESGERLQLLIGNLCLSDTEDDLLVSTADTYKLIFSRVRNFIKKAINKYLTEIQENDPAAVLIKSLSNPDFIHQIDIIEIFLITNNISIEPRGKNTGLKTFKFPDDKNETKYTIEGKSISKSLVVKYQLIDLNKIYSYEISEGNSEPLVITFDEPLRAIKAAKEDNYESYLSVVPATLLINIYKEYSSRLLERNVRSFLSFKGVNKGIRETLRHEPEKFVAFNNGLTITATQINAEEINGLFLINQLTDFQIVNGGQTTASIYFSSKEGIDVGKVNVTAKINIVRPDNTEAMDDLISKISQYSNSQSRISNVDLNSKSPYLVRIKHLSESMVTPQGQKWFFERAKGEFNTQIKISPRSKNQLEKTYPKEKRLTKEQTSKYYVAWGDTPYLVRKGGEKVFRDFMSFIRKDRDGKDIDAVKLGRVFYEDLIAKGILFKEFEKIYGAGINSMGQIRSAVVPYALALLFQASTDKKKNLFNLGKLWIEQKLPNSLVDFSTNLLRLTHILCVSYAKSDDKSEYAKKEELWLAINNCHEVKEFFSRKEVILTLKQYMLDKQSFEIRYKVESLLDFNLLIENCRIHQRTADFYKRIEYDFRKDLSESELLKIQSLIKLINEKSDLTEEIIKSEKKIVSKVLLNNPDWIESIDQHGVIHDYENAASFIIKIYLNNPEKIKVAFEVESVKAQTKDFYKALVFKQIGEKLSSGILPSVKDIFFVSEYLNV